MHIYFSGILGAGLSSLAHIALDLGFSVSGSDQSFDPNDYQRNESAKSLIDRGVNILSQQSTEAISEFFEKEKENKNQVDWFVHTAALKNIHPEFIFVKEYNLQNNNLKISKRHEFINWLLKYKNLKLIAIAGTHGKTTTTSMFVWLFKQLSIPVSYMIGSTISFGPSGYYEKDSQYFIYECDEFDRNFLNFYPDIALISSLDYDHPDTYPTQAEYFLAFKQFIQQSQYVYAWQEDIDNLSIESFSDKYNFSKRFDPGEDMFAISGVHNRQNAELVFKASEFICKNISTPFKTKDNFTQTYLQEFFDKQNDIFASFPGAHRRFEKISKEYNLYSDYAHHPKEIEAVIKMARELIKDGKI